MTTGTVEHRGELLTNGKPRDLVSSLTVGLGLCLIGQAIFWLEIGGRGAALLPFLWAYLQQSMIRTFLGVNSAISQGLVWLVSYVLLSLLATWGARRLGRVAALSTKLWPRIAVAWLVLQSGMVAGGWWLYAAGVLKME